MQLKFIRQSCPECRQPLVLTEDKSNNLNELQCLTKHCGYAERIPIDIAMQLKGAPQLPGFEHTGKD